MRLFDTHCHLDLEPFSNNVPEHILDAQSCDVERILIPAVSPSNWQVVSDIASKHLNVYYALGLHPYFLNANSEQYLQQLERMLKQRGSRCVALGECGLDGAIDMEMAFQESILREQIIIANELKLPLVLHSRKTHNQLIQILKQEKFEHGGVLHAFSGSYQQAMQYVDLGFYIGVGGVITYPRANKTRQAVTQLPLDHLVLETDAPDMPLNGYQGKANHPKMLGEILSCLAELKQQPKQTIAQIAWKNSNLAFGICE